MRTLPASAASSGDGDGNGRVKSGARIWRSEGAGVSTYRLIEYAKSEDTGIAGRSAGATGTGVGPVGAPLETLRGQNTVGSAGETSKTRQADSKESADGFTLLTCGCNYTQRQWTRVASLQWDNLAKNDSRSRNKIAVRDSCMVRMGGWGRQLSEVFRVRNTDGSSVPESEGLEFIGITGQMEADNVKQADARGLDGIFKSIKSLAEERRNSAGKGREAIEQPLHGGSLTLDERTPPANDTIKQHAYEIPHRWSQNGGRAIQTVT
ncbi:hypothetical protein CORC01_04665 [Colletotrichum orchidophilum]|uniref:Uncharacterized protein n=1 Tax=Colletotrichum orchidophilum TaxID=1209926 RepID=A0A1G4BF72_9PEZI|nr:uncharacterized protein CORC01_04665 [Colletotrichum orchidophilum]OHF00019.1 hypothetical protein CORC01_04665 [Colletotrichum orchidophilum]